MAFYEIPKMETMNSKDESMHVKKVPNTTGNDWGECPICRKYLYIYGKDVVMNFCHYCGQKITWWSEDE